MAQALAGKTVVITGASSGIGLASAHAFSAAGAHVVAAARRKDRIEALAEQLRQAGAQAIAVACDVTRAEDRERLFARARAELGGVDVLVNNAGVGLAGRVEELTPELMREVFEVNVVAPVQCVRAALPDLRARRGVVVNVSSVLGRFALPRLGGYCASKSALEALSESLRAELSADGVAVIVVCPGRTDTEFRERRRKATDEPDEDVSALSAMSSEEVAAEIVTAVRRRKREVVLTLPGRAMANLHRFAPGLMDVVAARLGARMKGSR